VYHLNSSRSIGRRAAEKNDDGRNRSFPSPNSCICYLRRRGVRLPKARGRPAGPSHRITAAMYCPAPSLLLAVVAVFMAKRKKPTGSVRREPPAKARKGRGGARDRAGRPPLLSWEQDTWLCTQLENRWNESARADAKQRGLEAERERFKRRAPYLTVDPIERLDTLSKELRDIPLSERKERAGREDKLGEGDHAIDEKIGDIREFVRLTEPDDRNAEAPPDHQLVTARERRGYRTYPGGRPKGRREALTEEVIALFEARYGIRLKADDVKSRWKRYRSDLGITHRKPKD
jgi:hypothetical protein